MKKVNNNLKTKMVAIALATVTLVSTVAVPVSAATSDAVFSELSAVTVSQTGRTTATMRFRGPVADYFNEHKTELKDKLLKAANSKVDEYCEKVPIAGDLLKSVVGKLFGKFMSKSNEVPQMTVNELNECIQQYKSELENAIKKSKDEIENDILCVAEVQSFYNEFVKFISMIDDYVTDIDAISNMKISEEAKTLKIAKLIGNPDDWTKTYTSVFGAYNTSVNMLKKAGLLSTHDIYTAIYDYYAGKSMFSGEAKMQAQQAVDYIHSQFIYSYAVLTECLTAHLDVLDMEDTSTLPKMEYNNFSSNIEDVVYRIETLTNQIMGNLEGDAVYDEEGNVVRYENVTATDEFSMEGSYEKFNNIYDYTFINKQTLNKGGKDMSPELFVSKWSDFNYHEMNERLGKQGLSEKELMDIVKHANSKGYSIYRYLEKMGFNADIPENIKKSQTYIPVKEWAEYSNNKSGTKYTTKYFINAVIAYRDAEAENDSKKENRPTYEHKFNYATLVQEWWNDRCTRKPDKWTTCSDLKDSYIMFLQTL